MADSLYFRKEDVIDATSHGRLSHWHQGGVLAFVTWQLVDALPSEFKEWLAAERRFVEMLRGRGSSDLEAEHRVRRAQRKLEMSLDSGAGACLLRHPGAAAIVAESLFTFDGERYELDSFVVMPNHVHVLVALTDVSPLPKVVQGWKGVSSRRLKSIQPGHGATWQEGYWDRLIRNPRHHRAVRRYISENPAKAKLAPGAYYYWSKPSVLGEDEV